MKLSKVKKYLTRDVNYLVFKSPNENTKNRLIYSIMNILIYSKKILFILTYLSLHYFTNFTNFPFSTLFSYDVLFVKSYTNKFIKLLGHCRDLKLYIN